MIKLTCLQLHLCLVWILDTILTFTTLVPTQGLLHVLQHHSIHTKKLTLALTYAYGHGLNRPLGHAGDVVFSFQ